MNNIETVINVFIEKNIKDFNEIHISLYLSNKIKNFNNFLEYNDEQDILGDTYIGDLLLKNKTIKVFYNILYDYNDIQFIKNEE